MRNMKTKQVALTGVLFALAMVLSFVESTLSPLLGLPPGVKLGLANIVVMFSLFCLSVPYTVGLVVLKALFGMLTRGVTAGALSLCGGVLSMLVMLVLMQLLGKNALFILSACGAIAHNMGQLLALRLIFTQSVYTLYYMPVLLVSGLVMGTITSLLLKALLPHLKKINFKSN